MPDSSVVEESAVASGAPAVPRAAAVRPPHRPRHLLLRRWLRRLKTDVRYTPKAALLLAFGTVVTGGLIPDAIKGTALFPGWDDLGPVAQLLSRVGVVLLVFAFGWGLFLRRRDLMSVATLSQEDEEKYLLPKQALVLPLSPSKHLELHPGSVVVFPGPSGQPPTRHSLTGRLDDDIESINAAKWTWQQLLRAVRPHLPALQIVYLLGSRDARGGERGTYAQIHEARAFLQSYLPDDVRVEVWPEPVDFEDVRRIMRCMERIIAAAKDVPRRGESPPRRNRAACLREEDIIIDVTGGLKPTSIAGAMMSLNSPVTFQYVHTTRGVVIEYDLLHTGSSGV